MKRINKQVAAKSLIKGISIINLFNPNKLFLDIPEVAQKLNISKAAAYRNVKALVQCEILEKIDKSNKYTIGPVLYFKGNLYLSTRDVLREAQPVLETLRNLTGTSAHLSFYSKGMITVIMKAIPRNSYYRFEVDVGAIRPAYVSSMGKAFLSELTEKEIDELYPEERLPPLTKYTIPTKTELKIQLEQIKKRGVSYTYSEGTEGIEGIASLIRDNDGKAIAAMSIHLTTNSANATIREKYSELIKMGCSLISYRLGYPNDKVIKLEQICNWWAENKEGLSK